MARLNTSFTASAVSPKGDAGLYVHPLSECSKKGARLHTAVTSRDIPKCGLCGMEYELEKVLLRRVVPHID